MTHAISEVVLVLDRAGTLRAVGRPPAGALRVAGGRWPGTVFAVLHPDDHGTVRSCLADPAAAGATAGPIWVRMDDGVGSWWDAEVFVTVLGGGPGFDDAVLLRAVVHPAGRPAAAPGYDPASDPLALDLEEALRRHQFRLVYQPKVALSTNRVVGLEALLRWDHPERGPVAPNDFIPVAEATGLIGAIGAWVLGDACRTCAGWQRDFPRPTPVSVAVNASATQFRVGLVDAVRTAIAESGIDPGGLCLEVTESTVMEDVEIAISILGQLKSLGLTVSIDDFGTGYSSLEYLRRLPLDEVKIDRSFVGGLSTDPEDTAIVAAVISLAHALDREVVAEGVETVEQLERLRALGCEVAQGFLLARPMAAGDVTDLLRRDAAGERVAVTGSGRCADGAGTETILVADDADDVRQLARMTLTAAGFRVEEAGDGSSAVELARKLAPACVVLDVSMPDLSGIEVCARLRADPATADCTVVMLTTSDSAADKAAAFSAGADEYMVKPFAPRDLVSRVRLAIGRRAGGG
ncbi:MAG: EAL domain-containing protein [Actinomycetota bacterium]